MFNFDYMNKLFILQCISKSLQFSSPVFIRLLSPKQAIPARRCIFAFISNLTIHPTSCISKNLYPGSEADRRRRGAINHEEACLTSFLELASCFHDPLLPYA